MIVIGPRFLGTHFLCRAIKKQSTEVPCPNKKVKLSDFIPEVQMIEPILRSVPCPIYLLRRYSRNLSSDGSELRSRPFGSPTNVGGPH